MLLVQQDSACIHHLISKNKCIKSFSCTIAALCFIWLIMNVSLRRQSKALFLTWNPRSSLKMSHGHIFRGSSEAIFAWNTVLVGSWLSNRSGSTYAWYKSPSFSEYLCVIHPSKSNWLSPRSLVNRLFQRSSNSAPCSCPGSLAFVLEVYSQ